MIVLGRREASITLPKENGAFQMESLGRSWGGWGFGEEVDIVVFSGGAVRGGQVKSLLSNVSKGSWCNTIFTVVVQ